MSKETHKKLALADYMAHAEQRKNNKKTYKNIYIDPMGGEEIFEKIDVTRVLSMMDGVDDDNAMDNLDLRLNLIYQCCPVLRKPELQDAYDCKEPTDIVRAVFEDNIMAISRVADEILAFYGLEDPKDAVKN